jgi:purine-binding chemotaxis protein CheW
MLAETPGNLYVIALIAGQRVAFEAATVAAVVDLANIVPVPLAPPHVIGVCALRSLILTVVDLAGALGQPLEQLSRRAVTMEIGGHHYAFVVSSVEQVEPSTEKPQAIDASIGADWKSAATARVQTESGTALLLNPQCLVGAHAGITQ